MAEPEKVICNPPHLVTDSIALDDEAYAKHPAKKNEARWDYWLGTEDTSMRVVGVEVHPVTPREVELLVRKKRWAEEKADAELAGGKKSIRAWFWVASGKTALSVNTTEYRQMVKAGIVLAGGCLRLPLSR
ncbi:MAG: hypothetical protein IPM54_12005 [Polyangiaceae bacterium]|nr:hypothetical protein [Polyangiaceae bacterium]